MATNWALASRSSTAVVHPAGGKGRAPKHRAHTTTVAEVVVNTCPSPSSIAPVAIRRPQPEDDGASAAPASGASQQPGAQPMWLPDKQLWLPGSGNGHSSNGSSSSSGNGNGGSVVSALPSGSVATAAQPAAAGSNGPGLSRVFMASAATQGRKPVMEDRHVLAALDPATGVQPARGGVGLQQQVSIAGVFDGHAGAATAAYAAQHIPHLLHAALSGRPADALAGAGGPILPARQLLAPPRALSASFHWFDRWWADARCDPAFTEHGWDDSGSTAVVGLVVGQQLVVANAGDSVALLARGGRSARLSVDHRLDNSSEAARVVEAGGRLVAFKPGAPPRVMGSSTQTRYKGSMVTRSLGDFAFKHPQALLSAEPHVAAELLVPGDQLIVLASDGVTDVLPDDDMLAVGTDAVRVTRERTSNGHALAKAAAVAIMDAALRGGSTDNITVVAILLDWGSQFSSD